LTFHLPLWYSDRSVSSLHVVCFDADSAKLANAMLLPSCKGAIVVEYVNFGKAGVKVSPLALGLGFRRQPDPIAAQRVIEHAIDLGINFIDCANVYSVGTDQDSIVHSETVLGKALQGRRDDVVITTKAASSVGSGPNDVGLSRYHIMREVDRSLTRLNTDHIDVYLVHVIDDSTPLPETIRALDDLVRAGKVRYIGCCNYEASWRICKALWIADTINATPYMCIQNQYSLLNRSLEREIFGLVREEGLGVMVYSPLGVGLLSGVNLSGTLPPPEALWESRHPRLEYGIQEVANAVISSVKQLAGELDKTPAQLALAWVLSHPEITVAIIGCDTTDQVTENVGALGWTLDDSVREKLDAVSAPLT
jgi:aryl-alcohol dehydrogenase-like predicted oxidoreductase